MSRDKRPSRHRLRARHAAAEAAEIERLEAELERRIASILRRLEEKHAQAELDADAPMNATPSAPAGRDDAGVRIQRLG